MLFAEPLNLQNMFPWVIVALAVIMLVGVLGKSVSIYLNLKRNQKNAKLNQTAQKEEAQHEQDTQDKETENNDKNI